MEPEKIKVLLKRFYAGETSLTEESLLKKFFAQPNVPEEFLAEKEHFLLLMQWQKESPLDDAFDAHIMKEISRPQKSGRAFVGWYALAGVAATVLLLLALWLGNRQDHRTNFPGTTHNVALVYAQARSALQLVSENLNTGIRPAEQAVAHFDQPLGKASEIGMLTNAMKPVKNIQEIERARALMQSMNSVYIKLKPLK